MTLILNNEDVKSVLTMEITMEALDRAYRELARQEAVCRPRVDIQIPTKDQEKIYQWGTMEGGSISGYFAIRMKSDVIYEQEYQGAITQEKYCVRPGRFCGLILLTSIENGEPLALINDGYLQHMRVGADSGIGAKYMAREDAEVVGMIGSGGMARSHVESFLLARRIKKIQVYSPTKTNRDAYAREISENCGLSVTTVDNPHEVYKGADIVAGCTDSAVPIVIGKWLEEGTHVTCVGGKPDEDTIKRIDVSLRLGNAPAPWGLPEFGVTDEYLTYAARPKENAGFEMKRSLIAASDALQQVRVHQVKVAIVGFEPQRRFHVRHGCVELRLAAQNSPQIHVGVRVIRIELERDIVLFDCFVQFPFLL